MHNINYIKDVTSEYGCIKDIWFPIPKDYSKEKGHIFLAILNEMEWQPISWGIFTPLNLEFHSLKSGLYLPVYYHKGVQTPAWYPFNFDYNGCRYYQPSSSRTMAFHAIAPGGYGWIHRVSGGKFEVANRSDFSDAKTIHTIEKTGLGYHTVSVRNTPAYRYIRYVSPVGGRCNISILEFYNENNEKLQGTAIGSSGAYSNVFDGNVDTYYESATDPSWVGMDFGEVRRINKIRYMPRTEGYGIYEGHVYELFYWNGNEWQSLGKQTADSHVLKYKAPDRSLLYLKNLTKNRMYKTPFVVESGEQKWFQTN